jgi:hypothetical protein
MCNLYSITTNQAAIIALFRVINRYVGNLLPMPGVFPDCCTAQRPLLRCSSILLQASSASANVLKGEPPILIAPLPLIERRHDAI